jgi:hypothetical protein
MERRPKHRRSSAIRRRRKRAGVEHGSLLHIKWRYESSSSRCRRNSGHGYAVRWFSTPMRLVAAVRIRAGQDANREAISKGTFFIQSLRDAIDERHLWRYSQAQIPDLVANAIPRFRQAAQSSGSATPLAARNSFKIQLFSQPIPAVVRHDASGSVAASNLLALTSVAGSADVTGSTWLSTTAGGRCPTSTSPMGGHRNH